MPADAIDRHPVQPLYDDAADQFVRSNPVSLLSSAAVTDTADTFPVSYHQNGALAVDVSNDAGSTDDVVVDVNDDGSQVATITVAPGNSETLIVGGLLGAATVDVQASSTNGATATVAVR